VEIFVIRKIVAVDSAHADWYSREKYAMSYFPVDKFCSLVAGDDGEVDVVETLVTAVRKIPENESPEAVATACEQYASKVYALEMSGARVIECPAKRVTGGYRNSGLMIACLATCLRLMPDYLVLVASDGDYRPLIEELRSNGIRTEVVSPMQTLSNDLRRVCVNVIDMDNVLENINIA
jgi:hypothetical protein